MDRKERRKAAEVKVLDCFNFPPDQEIFKGEYRGVVCIVWFKRGGGVRGKCKRRWGSFRLRKANIIIWIEIFIFCNLKYESC